MKEDPVQNAPVTGLQWMLRRIAFDRGLENPVIPDGIYGDATAAAVSEFQRAQGLPVTGIAEDTTFAALVRAYNQASVRLSPAQPPVIHFPAALHIRSGQSHPHVRLAQAMLEALRQSDPQFRPNGTSGILDAATADNLKLIQSYALLPMTGELDKETWDRLSILYRAFYDRDLAPSQG